MKDSATALRKKLAVGLNRVQAALLMTVKQRTERRPHYPLLSGVDACACACGGCAWIFVDGVGWHRAPDALVEKKPRRTRMRPKQRRTRCRKAKPKRRSQSAAR